MATKRLLIQTGRQKKNFGKATKDYWSWMNLLHLIESLIIENVERFNNKYCSIDLYK